MIDRKSEKHQKEKSSDFVSPLAYLLNVAPEILLRTRTTKSGEDLFRLLESMMKVLKTVPRFRLIKSNPSA